MSFRMARISRPSEEMRQTPISGVVVNRVTVVPAGIVTTRLRLWLKPITGCSRRYFDSTQSVSAIGEPFSDRLVPSNSHLELHRFGDAQGRPRRSAPFD